MVAVCENPWLAVALREPLNVICLKCHASKETIFRRFVKF